MLKILKSKKGDGYIDVVVAVLVSTTLLVLAINVFSFLTVKQKLDYFSKEVIYIATSTGKTHGAEITNRVDELAEETGILPFLEWDTIYFKSSDKTVQYGDSITVTIKYYTQFKGLGIVNIPMTLSAQYSGLSMKYWK